MTEYIALVQQDVPVSQKAVASGTDKELLQQQADEVAKKLNATESFELGWTATVLPIEQPD